MAIKLQYAYHADRRYLEAQGIDDSVIIFEFIDEDKEIRSDERLGRAVLVVRQGDSPELVAGRLKNLANSILEHARK